MQIVSGLGLEPRLGLMSPSGEAGADYTSLSEMDDVVLDCLRGAIWSDHSSLPLLTKQRPRVHSPKGQI